MIKFFRKIRQNMIKEDKIIKYLLYAFGEIILVVIGILIALSINNYNTLKKERALEFDYLERLTSEIKEEVAYYDTLKTNFEKKNNAIIRMLKMWNSDTKFIKDSTQFFNDFFAGNGVHPWYKEPVIWTQLVQSGELSLIKDQELIEGLYKHYANLNRAIENFKEYPTQTTNEARKLLATAFVNEEFLTTAGSLRPLKPTPETLNYILENDKIYRELFTRVAIIARIHMGVMDRLSKSGNKVILLLENHQNAL